MGRPREHDLHTANALVEAAERTLENEGPEALSVRRVAEAAGTSTRAVYSLFGSREGLVVALGDRAFGILETGVAALPATDDPAADLVDAAVRVFRPFALAHPSLFRIVFQRQGASPQVLQRFAPSAAEALRSLRDRVGRVLGATPNSREVVEATIGFHALCEGLAALELRGILPAGAEERLWHEATTALVAGAAARAARHRTSKPPGAAAQSRSSAPRARL
jgi:AcrR family transcriptional regulator